MPRKTWVVTNWADRTYVEDLAVTPVEVGGAAQGYSVHKQRLRGGLCDGVDRIRVDTGPLRFDVLPTRGMSLWKAWTEDGPIGWHSPVRGPVHPQFVPLTEASGLGWLDGFDEWLVRCGLESNGAPEFEADGRLKYGLHGRIGNKPAHRVELSVDGETGTIRIVGIVDETRFHFFKLRMTTTIEARVGESTIAIRDTISNLSASPTEAQMLYHINFGPPLLAEGSQVVAAAKTVVPRNDHSSQGLANWSSYSAPKPGTVESVYFFELLADQQHETQVLLKNPQSSRGTSLSFNVQQLPCFTLWKNTTAEADGYVTGLEPGTNFPNPRSYEGEQGRVVRLSPGGNSTFDLRIDVHQSPDEVARAVDAIHALRIAEPQVHDRPMPGWCAD